MSDVNKTIFLVGIWYNILAFMMCFPMMFYLYTDSIQWGVVFVVIIFNMPFNSVVHKMAYTQVSIDNRLLNSNLDSSASITPDGMNIPEFRDYNSVDNTIIVTNAN